jgi:hypothetical protein
MTTSPLDLPAHDEIEVSVFGPGYGEAIAVHTGAGYWVLIDSCIPVGSDLSASLQYLQELEVQVQHAVKLIVVTHWHDDHIRGMSQIVRACESAALAVSGALHNREFFKLVAICKQHPSVRPTGVDEFTEIVGILESRKQPDVRRNVSMQATVDRLLFRDSLLLNSNRVEVKVSALSPSDAAIVQAQLAFARLLPQAGANPRQFPAPRLNHASIVLWLEIGDNRLLLGADLENARDPSTGWSIILTNSTVVKGARADVFKIPHHGSANAHHDDVWSTLLHENPFAVLTPFGNGRQMLPTAQDVDRILQFTSRAYATAPPRIQQPRRRRRIVKDWVRQATREIRDVHPGWGHVRLRRRIDQPNIPWQVSLFGDAYALAEQNRTQKVTP